MASIATVVTMGFGSFGSVNLLPTIGYGSREVTGDHLCGEMRVEPYLDGTVSVAPYLNGMLAVAPYLDGTIVIDEC